MRGKQSKASHQQYRVELASCLIVQEGVYNAFTKAVTEKVAQFKLGDGLKQGTTLGPLINAKAVQRVSRIQSPISVLEPVLVCSAVAIT